MNPYLILGSVGVAIALCYGSYSFGYNNGSDNVQLAFNEYKLDKQEAEQKYANDLTEARQDIYELNERLEEKVTVKYIDRVNTITKTEYENRDVIREVFTNSPYLTKGYVYAHNQMIQGLPIDANLASSTEASEFTEAEAIQVINYNYTIALQAKEKDESWNTFYQGIYDNYATNRLSNTRSGETARGIEPSQPTN